MSTLAYISTNTICTNAVYSKCKKCPYLTKSRFFINNHVRRHLCTDPLAWFDCSKSNLEGFICRDCDFHTQLAQTFREHIRNHNVKREDHKSILKSEDTLETTNEMNISENYECKPFLQIHPIKFESLGTFYNSKYKSEADKPELGQHILHATAENSKYFQCYHCSQKFKTKANLRSHILTKHANLENVGWHYCDKCSFKSKWKESLGRHITCQHTSSDEVKWFQCDYCSYKAKRKYELNSHTIYKHTAVDNVKWFQCDHCSHKAKIKEDLRRHVIQIHAAPENIKWFQCDSCLYKSKKIDHLRRHTLFKHTAPENAKWFQCVHCSYKSKTKGNLGKHFSSRHGYRK